MKSKLNAQVVQHNVVKVTVWLFSPSVQMLYSKNINGVPVVFCVTDKNKLFVMLTITQW